MNSSHLEVDEQHHHLISMLDGVKYAIEEHISASELEQLTATLQDLFITHFSAEERVYAHHHYPDSAALKRDHKSILNDLARLKSSLSCSSWQAALELLDTIKFTFLSHVTEFDDRFAPDIYG
ncbi:MAG: hemerythrin family protein [Gammaproteobacteria bacterium]|nr:hemerythrin family protein [Gammaproteobacteria bacterium]MDH5802305.1 hemerythrin family protein [Gammaproteobacteria bacterium]